MLRTLQKTVTTEQCIHKYVCVFMKTRLYSPILIKVRNFIHLASLSPCPSELEA